MTQTRRRRVEHVLDRLARQSPWWWGAMLAVAGPWLRIEWRGWSVYPMHLLLTVLVGHYIITRGRPRGAPRVPFAALTALLLWVAALSALRGLWPQALLALGALAGGWAWGWLAWLVGQRGEGAPLVLAHGAWLLISLLGGVVLWLGGWLWAPACAVLACDPEALPPPALHGLWISPGQFLLHLILVAPPLAALLVVRNRATRMQPATLWLLALGVAHVVALLTEPSPQRLVLLLAALGGMTLLLWPERHPKDLRLLVSVAVFALFAAVVLYGALPGYLQRMGTARSSGRVVLTLPQAPPDELSHQQAALLTVEVRNVGWQTLSLHPHQPAQLSARVLYTNPLGETRVAAEQAIPLPQPLPPEESVTLHLPLRSPPWLQQGFVSLRVTRGDGRPVEQAVGSAPGFRFRNPAYETLQDERDNRLSIAAERARTVQRLPVLTGSTAPDPHRLTNVVGDVLDSLVFSPLWGLNRPDTQAPLATPRPLLAQIFHRYGGIGLLLALWGLWGLLRRSWEIALHANRLEARLAWRFAALAVVLLILSGLSSPVLATWHAVWGLFLFAGFVESRHAMVVPPRRRRRPAPARPAATTRTRKRARPRALRRF